MMSWTPSALNAVLYDLSFAFCVVLCDSTSVKCTHLSVECPSVVCSLCAIAAAVPPRPEDVTVPVIVLFTIASSCVTDCNFNIVRFPCNGPVREVSP